MAESSYVLNINNDGSGGYNATLKRGATPASDGTAITGTVGGQQDLTVKDKNVGVIIERCKVLVADDRAAGN